MENNQLDFIFNPQSIAVIGVSRNEKSLGRMLLRNIISFGYKGKIYPIHPKAEKIENLPVFKNVLEIPGEVEMLVSIIPRDYVLGLIEQAREKNVKGLIIITAGFREVSEEGEILENKVKQMAKEAGIRVIGPNSMGILNGHDRMVNASFTPVIPISGNLSFISQSGAIGAVMMGFAKRYGVGFSKFVSVGNKMDINTNDLLPFLADDKNTKVITLYLESISEPTKFIELASSISPRKPIIAVKSGRTNQGSRAASSHTGALSSPDRIIDAAFRKSGIIRVDSIMDLMDTALAFIRCPLPKGKRVAVISNAGGPGTLATDSIIRNGLEVNETSEKSRSLLEEFLPLEASLLNPIDILPSAGIEGYRKCTEIVLDDPEIDMVLVIFLPPVLTKIDELVEAIESVAKNASKPVFAGFLGENGEIDRFKNISYPLYDLPEKAASMMAKLYEYSEYTRLPTPQTTEISLPNNRSECRPIIKNIVNEKREPVQHEIQSIMKKYGFSLPIEMIEKDQDQCKSNANDIKYPVVLKLASPKISHKSDAGGVILNIKNEEELATAWATLEKIYEIKGMPHNERTYLLQKFYNRGVEVALGISYDPLFGHSVMVGSGGILIELLEDIEFLPVPVSYTDASMCLSNLKVNKLLSGYRGTEIADRDQLLDNIIRLSKLVEENPEIIELDINPLLVMPQGERHVAIDIRMRLGTN